MDEFNGVKTVQVFDDRYYKFGDAFCITYKESGKEINGILLHCKNQILTFAIVEYRTSSNVKDIGQLRISIEDLKHTEIRRLEPERYTKEI